eukprot:scaffold1225_cov164-Amphora_coffeaeformis.AAC.17
MASSTSTGQPVWNVGILLFDNVEVLDFTGPYEVLSRARTEPGVLSRRTEDTAPFRVFTVAKKSHQPISAIGNLRVMADYSFDTSPLIHILLVPGGMGTMALVDDEETIAWIRLVADKPTTKLTTSVCSGALLLAKAGILDGKRATTHWSDLDDLEEFNSTITVDRTLRWVEDGNIVTSAGVAAGIDMAFHIVERMCGKAVADDTALYMEYPRRLATDPRTTTLISS